ncbi:VapE domain-containing protein [Phocaeicola sp.]|uniref:VapE domain-containing protein n=1 Tax=Phocaeicola sp. TaxID=2773926 RepID=UPI0023C9430C|nr:VapE domain-containing protein [Phocaeicola sp.]MDE5676843.1 DUF3874 domain-containing protein [Phocaeicola sp.]
MNVFATLRTIFFGSKVLSRPIPADGTPRRDLAIALNRLLPLCQTIPGMHLAVDIREGRATLVLDWTPRTDEKALSGACHYVVSNEGGVEEVAESRFLLTESGKSNPLESRGVASTSPVAISAIPKDMEKKAGAIFPKVPKDVESQFKPAVSKTSDKKQAKSRTLMQEVTAFLTSHYRFRFNVLTEETEVVAMSTLERDVPDSHLRYAKVDERWMNSLSLEAIEAGIDCWDRDIQRFVRSRRIGEYHPFTAYFEQLPEWDGTDRVTALARRVSDKPVWVNGFHRWMLGLAAQWMQFNPDENGVSRANSVAPLLVSSRQGLGKSTFCRLLMPNALKVYYTESYDLSSPASSEAKLAAYGLINLDEFDKLGASKVPLLKNLMQASALNIRKAYKRSASALPRIASFIGTSNREDLLVDRTGSRRFLCVSLKHAIDCTIPVDHEQLYAQLKAELLSGERCWFTKEEEEIIDRNNALFYKHIPEEEVFRLCFRFATTEDDPQEIQVLSATQLFERMKAAHPSAMRGMTAYSLSRILPQLGERVHTAKGNVYRVVENK